MLELVQMADGRRPKAQDATVQDLTVAEQQIASSDAFMAEMLGTKEGRTTEPRPTELGTGEPGPSDLAQSELRPSELAPTEMDPADLGLSEPQPLMAVAMLMAGATPEGAAAGTEPVQVHPAGTKGQVAPGNNAWTLTEMMAFEIAPETQGAAPDAMPKDTAPLDLKEEIRPGAKAENAGESPTMEGQMPAPALLPPQTLTSDAVAPRTAAVAPSATTGIGRPELPTPLPMPFAHEIRPVEGANSAPRPQAPLIAVTGDVMRPEPAPAAPMPAAPSPVASNPVALSASAPAAVPDRADLPGQTLFANQPLMAPVAMPNPAASKALETPPQLPLHQPSGEGGRFLPVPQSRAAESTGSRAMPKAETAPGAGVAAVLQPFVASVASAALAGTSAAPKLGTPAASAEARATLPHGRLLAPRPLPEDHTAPKASVFLPSRQAAYGLWVTEGKAGQPPAVTVTPLAAALRPDQAERPILPVHRAAPTTPDISARPDEVVLTDHRPEVADAERADPAPQIAGRGPEAPVQNPATAAPPQGMAVPPAPGLLPIVAGPEQAMIAGPVPADGSNPAATRPADPLGTQIAQLIVNRAEDRAEVLLEPAELGRLRFEIQHRGDVVQVVLSAERPETLDLMRRHGDQLLSEFKAMGFDRPELSFGSWGGGQERPRPAHVPEIEAGSDPTPPSPQPIAAARPTKSGSGGLDLRL